MERYVYRVVNESLGGVRGKRVKKIYRSIPDLTIGGLYAHLGSGFPGLQRVLSMDVEAIQE